MATIIKCPHCGKEHSLEYSVFCSSCGKYIKVKKSQFSIDFTVCAMIVAFIFGFSFLYARINMDEKTMIGACLFGITLFVGIPFYFVRQNYIENKLKKGQHETEEEMDKGNTAKMSTGVVVVLSILALCSFAGMVAESNTCSERYCSEKCVEGRRYCSKHQPKTIRHSSTKDETICYPSTKGKSISNTGSSTGKSVYNYSTRKSSHYDAYDEGYDAIAEDDDYDWDRYWSDDDYARGVDDALDDYDWD